MKWIGSCFFLCITLFSKAQPQNIQLAKGKWTIQQYSTHIIKLTFQPKGYTTNENISDAVILKPTNNTHQPAFKRKGDTLFIGNAKLVQTCQAEQYRGFRFLLDKNEMIFGGGERALPLNRRGYRLNLYNAPAYGYSEGAENLNYSVPFFTSSRGYALFFDNPSKGYADIGKTNKDIFEAGFISGELNVYIIEGNDYASILSSYHQLTGTQPLPPRWALGNLMSRFGYTSQQEVADIAATMKEQHIPLDAVIFDLFWFGDSVKGTMGNLEWVNHTKWPAPEKMIRSFNKQDIKTILITEPFVVQHTLKYQQARPYFAVDSIGRPYSIQDFFFGSAGLIDIFRKDARNWFWQFYQQQMNKGVEAWWGDLGEPEKHPTNLYHNLASMGYKRLFSADEVHNVYGHTWTKMLFEKYAQYYPSKRLFSLNRSGFAGTQRYSIFPWSGDVRRSWSGLRAQLQVMLGMSMSGIPYAHGDAGGFAGGDGDNELYIRWLEFAAYTPIFRPHGTALFDVDTSVFSFPSEPALLDSPYNSIARSIVQKRYQLLPYNYTLAWRQARYGEPLVRPLYYQFPTDTTAVHTEDEFMWGNDILVAPVIEKDLTTRKVYLPAGKWYDEKNGTLLEGSQTIECDVTRFHIPRFIKEGSFVCQYASVASNTQGLSGNEITLLYIPSATPTHEYLYQDDGADKNAMLKNQFELLSFSSSGIKEQGVQIRITSNGGVYKGKNASQKFSLFIPGLEEVPKAVFINGKKWTVNDQGLMVDANHPKNIKGMYLFGRFNCDIVFTGKPVTIEMKW